jgi:hypothetical protein
VVASRVSNRTPRDGIPIAERASMRMSARNNNSGMITQNLFIVLNNTPDDMLQSVIDDLDIDASNAIEQLNVFKLEELARWLKLIIRNI